MASPFLKWAGGKRRLVPELLKLVKERPKRYLEPFLGGGAMFFALHSGGFLAPGCDVELSDLNSQLMLTYRAIQDPTALPQVIWLLQAYAADHSRDTYYQRREQFNRSRGQWKGGSVYAASEQAALFIYLNHTCFNGLYRVNKAGKFNVPMGSYSNPRILDEDNLRAASAALSGIDLSCWDFHEALVGVESNWEEEALAGVTFTDFSLRGADRKWGPGALVYMDPPYAPRSETSNFTTYTPKGFSWDDQEQLAELASWQAKHGARVIISNSDIPEIRAMYEKYGLEIHTVACSRSINSDSSARGKIPELLAVGG